MKEAHGIAVRGGGGTDGGCLGAKSTVHVSGDEVLALHKVAWHVGVPGRFGACEGCALLGWLSCVWDRVAGEEDGAGWVWWFGCGAVVWLRLGLGLPRLLALPVCYWVLVSSEEVTVTVCPGRVLSGGDWTQSTEERVFVV